MKVIVKTFQIDSAATRVNNFVTLEANEDTAVTSQEVALTQTVDLDITAQDTGKVGIDDLNDLTTANLSVTMQV